MAFVDVHTQAELDAAVDHDDVPVCRGDGHFTATDSSTVRAGSHVAVHKHPGHVGEITGGVVIERPDLSDVEAWIAYHGIEVTGRGKNRKAWVYKAVESGYLSQHKHSYKPGATVDADDWDGKDRCGGGLHFSAHPVAAQGYCMNAEHYLRCPVYISELVVITEGGQDKVKARRVVKPGCVEVDIDGVEL